MDEINKEYSNKSHHLFRGSEYSEIEEIVARGLSKVIDGRDETFMDDVLPEHSPELFSIITLGLEFDTYKTDVSQIIEYHGARGMQYEVIDWLRCVFSPELLQHVQNGNIKSLCLQIKPRPVTEAELLEAESYKEKRCESVNLADIPN